MKRPPAVQPRSVERGRRSATAGLPGLHLRLLQLLDPSGPGPIQRALVQLSVEQDGIDHAIQPQATRLILAYAWAPVLSPNEQLMNRSPSGVAMQFTFTAWGRNMMLIWI